MSLLFGIAGIIVAPIYYGDWWQPLTLTNTIMGLEDFIFSFSFGGIAAVIYEEIFKKKIRIRKATKKQDQRKNLNLVLIGLIVGGLFFTISFFLNSFYGTIIAFVIGLLIIYIQRKDLIIDSLATGILVLILSFIIYWIVGFFPIEWVNEALYFEMLPKITILNISLEDIIWFFLAGAFIGPLYEYWQEGRIVRK